MLVVNHLNQHVPIKEGEMKTNENKIIKTVLSREFGLTILQNVGNPVGFGGAAWFGYHVVQEPVSTFNVVAGIAVMFFGLTLKAWATYQLKHR